MLPGKGSYGSVYEARVKDTEDRVAIKVIPVGENDDIEDIQKEIDMLKECDHPNVVHYLVSWLRFAHALSQLGSQLFVYCTALGSCTMQGHRDSWCMWKQNVFIAYLRTFMMDVVSRRCVNVKPFNSL